MYKSDFQDCNVNNYEYNTSKATLVLLLLHQLGCNKS